MSSSSQTDTRIKVAVVTGRHGYDVASFQSMLRSIPAIDFYPQHLEDYLQDVWKGDQYDVIAFYNQHGRYQQATPGERDDELGMLAKGPLEALGEGDQGILVLHHGLTAFPKWQYWLDICGMGDTTTAHRPGPMSRTDQRLHIEVANPQHPITSGLASWDMVDETYNFADATAGSEVLLTTDHLESMRTIAWTRVHKNARVFCYQSGHDSQTFSNPQFRTVLARGVQWLAGRI